MTTSSGSEYFVEIRFVDHPGPFGWLCWLAQSGTQWDHVDVRTPDGRLLGARLIGGVASRDPNYDAGSARASETVIVPCTREQRDKFLAFAESQIGKPFDWVAMIGFAVFRNWLTPDHWFCCEFLAACFVAAGMLPERAARRFRRITLRDFEMMLMVIGRVA